MEQEPAQHSEKNIEKILGNAARSVAPDTFMLKRVLDRTPHVSTARTAQPGNVQEKGYNKGYTRAFITSLNSFINYMSNFWKIGVPVTAVVILIVAGIWYGTKSANTTETIVNNPPVTTTTTTTTTTQTDNTSVSSDNSDAALAQDMANVDGQMDGLNSDSASANQTSNE